MPSKLLSLLDRVILPIRFLFGALFIYTSLWRSLHGEKFLQSIKDYQIISGPIVAWSGFLFIALEAGIWVAFVFGFFFRQGGIVAAAFFSGFSRGKMCALVLRLGDSCGCGLGGTQV